MLKSLSDIDISLSVMRLMRPMQIKEMEQSLNHLGQLQPVIVREEEKDKCQLIDGFKRYYAAGSLGWDKIEVNSIMINEATGKAMILNYNKESHSLVEYEEALIVYSLKKDHHLEQKEISLMVGCSTSWVCRRIAIIEKLDPVVQDQLRVGGISNTQARALLKLPRGNQAEMVGTIIAHQLTSRQSSLLVDKYLFTGNKQEQSYIVEHPLEVIKSGEKKEDIYDVRLSAHGNKLLKSTEILKNQQNIFIGQYTHHQTGQLKEAERILLQPNMDQLMKKSQTIQSLLTSNPAKR